MPIDILHAILLVFVYQSAYAHADKLVLLFVDGLRWDSVKQSNLPGLRKFFESGTKAEYLVPVFPSLCYPNYYTMMTGLYPESHGLIGNNVYDPIKGDFFLTRSDPERTAGDHWWDGGEPVWITAKRQNKSSYLYYLAGCQREINGHRPDSCTEFTSDLSMATLKRSMRQGLDKMEQGEADFVGLYYGQIDMVGHRYGPDSVEMREQIKQLDQLISTLLHDLWGRSLGKDTNVVLISDHGMTDISTGKVINLRQMMSRHDVDHVLEYGAYVSVWPKENKIDKVYAQLKSHAHLDVYRQHELPESWHYKHHRRVAPITAVADAGWYIQTHEFGYLAFGPQKSPARGLHGYHPDQSDMWGVFAVIGPGIKTNHTIPGLSVVHVYQVLSRLLNIQPRAHNGSWSLVRDMFTASPRPRDADRLAAFTLDVEEPSPLHSKATPLPNVSASLLVLTLTLLWTNSL